MMEDRLPELPKGWVRTKLGEILQSVKGKKPVNLGNRNDLFTIPYINIEAFEKKVFIQYTNESSLPTCGNSDTLIVWDGARCGLVGRGVAGIIGSTLAKLTCSEMNPSYLFYFLKTKFIDINKRPKGVGIPHVDPYIFWNIAIPLPPLPEQQRIVAKIEEFFTKLDAGIKALKKIKAQLKRYRQAVLKYAFEGKLTQEWRKTVGAYRDTPIEPASILLERIKEERKKEAKRKFKELPPIGTSELPELPEDWVWATMEQISTKVVDGVHKKPNYVSEGIPFITVGNLTAGDGIDFRKVRYISDEDHKNFCKRANPEKGDILITKDGTLGVARAVKTENPFSIFVSVAMMKPIKRYMNSDYLAAFINSPIGQNQTRKIGKGSGLRHLHLEDLRTISFPIAPLLEQVKIVEEIGERLSIADAVEKVVEQSFMQSNRLRQSILKRAFEGKLVPQDPTDEPAEKLLERIRAEKNRIRVNNQPLNKKKKEK